MKGQWILASVLILLLILVVGASQAQGPEPQEGASLQTPLGTIFTYQGQLKRSGEPVTADCSMAFRLHEAAEGGAQVGSPLTPTVPMSNSLFTVQLDFGASAFTGEARWLGIQVQCPGDDDYTDLGRQPLTAAPYALYALGVPWDGLRGIPAGFADGIDDVSAVVSGTQVYAGEGLARLASGDAVTLSLGAPYRLPQVCTNGQIAEWTGAAWVCGDDDVGVGGASWSLTGNASTDPLVNFLGTTDAVSLTLAVNGMPALRLSPAITSPNVIGGHSGNVAWTGVAGASIGGGGISGAVNGVYGHYGTVGGGVGNAAYGELSTVGGGDHNAAGYLATVGGGDYNHAEGDYSVVAGGDANHAALNHTFIGGGALNYAGGPMSVIGGGESISVTGYAATAAGGAHITVTGDYAAVGGGNNNAASSWYATIGGGWSNTASGEDATIGGGWSNTASSSWATVGGGGGNIASGLDATVGGGWYNIASGLDATIGGGYDNTASGSYTVVGGGYINIASNTDATIGGGYDNTASGYRATVGGGASNTASGQHATVGGGNYSIASGNEAIVGGGEDNWASGQHATIGGGYDNTASGSYTVVGGGYINNATQNYAAIGGGSNNTAGGANATVGGGYHNEASASSATVGGGYYNTASNNAATVPGGAENIASGGYSFAAGAQATASHDGSFVWSSGEATSSWGDRTFTVRAHGGARFYTAPGTGTGAVLPAGDGSWGSLSDRNAKANFAAVDGNDILARLAAIPVQTWNYTAQDPAIRHIGPMAQDFFTAFGVGADERYISTIDGDGVALAAIQALYAENQALERRVTSLEARLAALEAQTNGGATGAAPIPWALAVGGLCAFGALVAQRRHGGGVG